jgi:hypothetical protein
VKKTLSIKPNHGEMIKPKELIEIKRSGILTLDDRRIYNLLIQHAFGPNLADANYPHIISTTDLHITHSSNAKIRASLSRLRKTEVSITRGDGSIMDLPLLSTTIVKTTANRGTITYHLPPGLSEILNDSEVFAVLETEILYSFGSKYALVLYENIARRIRLSYIHDEIFTLDEIRDLLGVPEDKLELYKNLNKIAIQPAITEVNALAPFTIQVAEIHKGKKVTGLRIFWRHKTIEEKKAAFAELKRPRVGRKARITGTAEYPSDDEAIKLLDD